MSLDSPIWLLLLLPVAALAVVYLVQQRRRSRYAVRFATLPMLERLVPAKPGWRRHLPAALLLAVFVLLAIAASRPQLVVQVPRERATVVVAVDVSLSMQATDVDPDRLTAAEDAARTFIGGLPSTFNVGVVSFSGVATVLAPPSPDRQAALAAVDNLQLGEGTGIGEGVLTSLDQIQALQQATDTTDVPAQIVLLSDGTSTAGRDPASAATYAAQAGVPVTTIAYGTPGGTVTIDGEVTPVPVDALSLQSLAQATGGEAYEAESADALDEVYDDIGDDIGTRPEERDVTPWVVALALLLGLGAAGLSLRWFARLP